MKTPHEEPLGPEATAGTPAPRAPIDPAWGGARERYRLIALRLEARLDARLPAPAHAARGRVVVVTSPSAGDGKTTTAAHLALAACRDLGRRVVLVDGDLARPRLARRLGVEARRGVADVLRGEALLGEVLWRLGDDGLEVLPGIAAEGRGAQPLPAHLLEPLLDRLRDRRELVLVDAPAVEVSADAPTLARAADGVLLVVRAGATGKGALARALDALVDAPLLGCILNDQRHGPHGRDTGRRRGGPPATETGGVG